MKRPSCILVKPKSGSLWPQAGTSLPSVFMFWIYLAAGSIFGQDTGAIKKAVDPQIQPTPVTASGTRFEAKVAAARERAKLLHDVYSATLDVMHHRYFRRDGPVLPARAMEDVFEEMIELSGSYANWISVNTKAMSINHEPTTEFEKKAAAELASGKTAYEMVGKAVYRRAEVIPLRSSCVGCHTQMFSGVPTTPRFAGLVISIPLDPESK